MKVMYVKKVLSFQGLCIYVGVFHLCRLQLLCRMSLAGSSHGMQMLGPLGTLPVLRSIQQSRVLLFLAAGRQFWLVRQGAQQNKAGTAEVRLAAAWALGLPPLSMESALSCHFPYWCRKLSFLRYLRMRPPLVEDLFFFRELIPRNTEWIKYWY